MPCDTCFRECPHFKKRDTCPNHVVTTWQDDKGNAMVVHDCAPRRALEMQMRIDAHLVAVRGDVNQLQHSIASLAQAVAALARSLSRDAETKTQILPP